MTTKRSKFLRFGEQSQLVFALVILTVAAIHTHATHFEMFSVLHLLRAVQGLWVALVKCDPLKAYYRKNRE